MENELKYLKEVGKRYQRKANRGFQLISQLRKNGWLTFLDMALYMCSVDDETTGRCHNPRLHHYPFYRLAFSLPASLFATS